VVAAPRSPLCLHAPARARMHRTRKQACKAARQGTWYRTRSARTRPALHSCTTLSIQSGHCCYAAGPIPINPNQSHSCKTQSSSDSQVLQGLQLCFIRTSRTAPDCSHNQECPEEVAIWLWIHRVVGWLWVSFDAVAAAPCRPVGVPSPPLPLASWPAGCMAGKARSTTGPCHTGD